MLDQNDIPVPAFKQLHPMLLMEMTDLTLISESPCIVEDLQLQISSKTGHAYIIDPQKNGRPLKENINLILLIHELKKVLS